MDTAVIIFILAMLLGTVNGVFQGYGRAVFPTDTISLPFILAYFIFLYSPIKNNIKGFYNLLLAAAVFVSIHFIYAVVSFKTLFFLQRVVSRHIHIAQFAVPYLIATIIYATSRKRRIFSALTLPLIMLGVLFSQQRALYGSIALTILFLIGVFAYSRREWIKNNQRSFAIYTATTLLATVALLITLQLVTGGKLLLTLYKRLFIFLNPGLLNKDISWSIRWGEIKNALKHFENFWLFGRGFGVSQITRFRYVAQTTLDNSYAYLLWKTGVIGLLSLLYMYFVFFKRGISTLRKNILPDEKIFLVTALLNTAGMMLVAFTNSSIAHYRFIFVWAGLFACVEIIARKYD